MTPEQKAEMERHIAGMDPHRQTEEICGYVDGFTAAVEVMEKKINEQKVGWDVTTYRCKELLAEKDQLKKENAELREKLDSLGRAWLKRERELKEKLAMNCKHPLKCGWAWKASLLEKKLAECREFVERVAFSGSLPEHQIKYDARELKEKMGWG